MDISKEYIFKTLRIFIIVLTIFVGIKSIVAIREYSTIGNGMISANVISVSGVGEVLTTPDIAQFTYTISEEAKTAKEAQDSVSKKSASALST